MPITDASEFTRSISFEAAWDKRDPDPKKNYGVHGVEIRFVLTGPLGAVYMPVWTHWMLPEVVAWHEELAKENPFLDRRHAIDPLIPGASVHSRKPHEDFTNHREKCDFFDGPCWSEEIGCFASDAIWGALLRGGEAGLWEALEDLYRRNLADEVFVIEPEPAHIPLP